MYFTHQTELVEVHSQNLARSLRILSIAQVNHATSKLLKACGCLCHLFTVIKIVTSQHGVVGHSDEEAAAEERVGDRVA